MKVIKFKTQDDIDFERTVEDIKQLVDEIKSDTYQHYAFIGHTYEGSIEIIYCGSPLEVAGLFNVGSTHIISAKIFNDEEELE